MSIGTKIHELRTIKRLSQGDLADVLDVSRQSVSKWETDTSIPDLDKLIKLCDVFGISLDELTERQSGNPEASTAMKQPEIRKELPGISSTQKIMGILLLVLSLFLGILAVLFGGGASLILFFPISLALFTCGMICLLIRQAAFYWCIWAVFSVALYSFPKLVGISSLTVLGIIELIIMLVMGLFSAFIYREKVLSISRRKSLLLVFAWVLLIVAIYVLVFNTGSIYLRSLFNLFFFILIAILETYTVCYIRSLVHSKTA